jgi:2-iminoacetate synthase
MSFYDEINKYSWDKIENDIASKTEQDVRNALNKEHRDIEDFKALISPAGAGFLEEMAQKSQALTLERFGKTIQLYIPLYVSNYCANNCVYCGFSCKNNIKRKVLSMEEIKEEIEVIKTYGYEHILLVAGESPAKADVKYFEEVINYLQKDFSQIALEIQPLDVDEYVSLKDAGMNFVCVYQETYNKETYPSYHPKGKKSDYKYRLETGDRLGKAQVHKMGIGCLLGLEDWRTDSVYTALHLKYLEKNYWRTKYTISLPRLRPSESGFQPNSPISDKEMVQLICAYRLLDQEAEISISTRENRVFRDNVIKFGATSLSAGSSTEPGGYAHPNKALEQFSIDDDRTPSEIAEMIKKQGYEPVWKDWDASMSINNN